MSRKRHSKRGKRRVYTKLDGSIKRHAAGNKAETPGKGNLGKEVAGYAGDLAAAQLVNGVVPNPDDIMALIAPGKLNQYQKLGSDPYLINRIMRRTDLKYKSLIKTRKNGVLSKSWRVVANPNDPDSERAAQVADFVSAVLDLLNNFDADLEELLDAIPLGYAVSEIMWEQKEIVYGDGYKMHAWVPVDIRQRRQGRFGFAPDGSLRYQEKAGKFVEVPRGKFIVHTHGKENEGFHGTAEASEVFWAYWMKHHFVKWWAIFGEKFGMPTAIGKYPPNWDTTKKEALLGVIKKIQTEFGIVIPQGATIEFVEAQRTGSINTYKEFSEWCDKNMSEALTGQSLATGQGQSGAGSYAQSETHSEVKQEYTSADCKELMATINPQLIDTIVEFNFGGDVPAPKFVIDYEAEDLAAELEIDIKLINECGVELSTYYLYDKYKRPIPAAGEPVARGRVVAGPVYPGAPGGAPSVPGKPKSEGGEDNAENTDSGDDGADSDGDAQASHGMRDDTARGGCTHPAGPRRSAHFAAVGDDDDLNRRVDEYEAVAGDIVAEASEVYGDFGNAILRTVRLASDLRDARERLQQMAATGLWKDAIAYVMGKAKINAYLLAAAQVQRHAVEVTEDEAVANVIASRSARRRSFSLDELLASYEPLDPLEAIQWYEELTPLTPTELHNLAPEAQKAAVTVADVESKDLLGKVQDLISQFLQSGGTQAEFVDAYQAERGKYGLEAADNHHADQLFRTEMGRAYGAGRNRALTDDAITGAFPLWQYVAIMDDRTRPEHAAMDGFVAAPDDPVWTSKSPPWDYNCRCDIIPLTRRQIATREIVETGTVTMPDGSEVDPRTWPTSPAFRGLGF